MLLVFFFFSGRGVLTEFFPLEANYGKYLFFGDLLGYLFMRNSFGMSFDSTLFPRRLHLGELSVFITYHGKE